MSANLSSLMMVVDQARSRVTGREPVTVSAKQQEDEFFRSELKMAKDAWQRAEGHFREATDQDLIDQAAYDILAAKSRYTYLLKQARSRGLL